MKGNPKRKKVKRNLISDFAYIQIKIDHNKVAYYDKKNNKNNNRFSSSNSGICINFRKVIEIILIIFISSFINFNGCNPRIILSKISEITLKINGTGDIKIFYENYNFGEFEVFINGNFQNISKYIYHFENNLNDIKIVSKDTLFSASNMFIECDSITEINLSNFDSSQITDMESMFEGCLSLISLNLDNFNTSQVVNMKSMFAGCWSLISLNLDNFNTSQVVNMGYMFSLCYELSSLNLSNFDTSKVIDMNNMFSQCVQLISLNLSNFDTSKVTDISHMFYFCSKLEYVNFKNAKINSEVKTEKVTEWASPNLIISCENPSDIFISLFAEKKFNYCNNNSYYHQIKYVNYMEDSAKYDEYVCDICGQNFYTKHHIINENSNSYIDCFEIIDYYYLDENNWKYKPCYSSCKRCEINGSEINHNCLSCKDEFLNQSNIPDSNYKNCYLINENELLSNNSEIMLNRTEIIQNIIHDLISEYNIIDLNNGKYIIISDQNIIIQLYYIFYYKYISILIK